MRQTGYLPRPPTSTWAPEILHVGSRPGSIYIFQVSRKSVLGSRSWVGSKIAHSHWLGPWLIQQPVLPHKPWYTRLKWVSRVQHPIRLNIGHFGSEVRGWKKTLPVYIGNRVRAHEKFHILPFQSERQKPLNSTKRQWTFAEITKQSKQSQKECCSSFRYELTWNGSWTNSRGKINLWKWSRDGIYCILVTVLVSK